MGALHDAVELEEEPDRNWSIIPAREGTATCSIHPICLPSVATLGKFHSQAANEQVFANSHPLEGAWDYPPTSRRMHGQIIINSFCLYPLLLEPIS